MTNLTFISHHIDSCHPRNNQGLWVILLKKNSRKTLERGPTYEETFLFNLDEDMHDLFRLTVGDTMALRSRRS